MPQKDKRAVVVASGPKSTDGRLNVRYRANNGHSFDATVMGPGVIGTAVAGLAPSTSTTGGTLAASTYFYNVSAIINGTETALATEVSQVTTGATSTVTLNWTAKAGASAYRVYGRATGVPLFMAQVATNSFVDLGAITPVGAFVAGTLGLKLKMGSNAFQIDNVKAATTMRDVNAYYTVF